MKLFDSHLHLDLSDFDPDRESIAARAVAAGVTGALNVGFDLPSSRRSVEIDSPLIAGAAVGIHPHEAASLDPKALAELRQLLRHPRVRAVGEIGLDFYRNLAPLEVQVAAFRIQLELAAAAGLPVIIHARESYPEVLQILKESTVRRGVVHCFGGDGLTARAFLDLGLHLGLGGTLTFRSSGDLREVVRDLPLERLLLETDAPYLAPVPWRGRRNEPAYLVRVAAELAVARKEEPETVAEATWRNSLELFGLEESG